MQKAEEAGCYKVILDCSEDNVAFYTKCGLTRKEVQMVRWVGRAGRSRGRPPVQGGGPATDPCRRVPRPWCRYL